MKRCMINITSTVKNLGFLEKSLCRFAKLNIEIDKIRLKKVKIAIKGHCLFFIFNYIS